MTEDRLRRWVLGQLAPDERREVTRWVVQCTDPDLGPLLAGLLRDAEERRADDDLRRAGTLWSSLVDKWNALLDLGAAGWSAGPGLTLARATGPATPWAEAVPNGEQLTVRLAPTSLDVLVVVTDDTGRVIELHAPGPTQGEALHLVVGSVPRPTVWAVRGAQLPRGSDPLGSLVSALERADVERVVVRWQTDNP